MQPLIVMKMVILWIRIKKNVGRYLPNNVQDHSLLSLEIFQLISATKYRSEFKERLQNKISFKNLPLKKLYHLFIFG